MYNYFVKIEYDGTNYVGWQNQKNGKSVQQVIEKAIKKILKSKINTKKINAFIYSFVFFFLLSPALYAYISISKDNKRTDYCKNNSIQNSNIEFL